MERSGRKAEFGSWKYLFIEWQFEIASEEEMNQTEEEKEASLDILEGRRILLG